ncbi:unnamed protein product [Lota lota]
MGRKKTRKTTGSGAGSPPGGAAHPPGDGAAAAGGGAPAAGSTGDAAEPRKPSNKSSKEVYFAVLPDKYEPLLEEESEEESVDGRPGSVSGPPEVKGQAVWPQPLCRGPPRVEDVRSSLSLATRRRPAAHHQNVGRALRWTWRSLVAGLQSLAGVYSAPFTAPTTLAAACSKA